MPPRRRPQGGAAPSQVEWMRQMGIIDNPMTNPQPSKPASPQQKGARTRARARAAAAQPPNYTPEMQQGGGGSRGGRGGGGGRSPIGSNLPQGPLGKNLPVPYKGPRLPATVAKPPPPPSKFPIKGILGRLGAIGTAFAIADTMKNVGIASGMSKPQNVIFGPAETKAAEIYGAQAVSDAKRGASGIPSPPRPQNVAGGASRSSKISSMSDYGAAPKDGKGGKFIRNAYYQNRLFALGANEYGDYGAIATRESRDAAMKEFKRTHKWARNAKTEQQKRNLETAVTYLQQSKHKRYWHS